MASWPGPSPDRSAGAPGQRGVDDVKPAPRAVPRVSGRLVAAAAAAAVIVAVAVYLQRASPPSSTRYLTAPVEQRDISSGVRETGPVAAATAVPLSFKISGKVAQIEVKVGDQVKAGQTLAALDPTDLRSQVRQAQANLDAAQAGYDKLVRGPISADVATGQAAVDAAKRQLADAQNALAATQTMAAKDSAAAQQAVANAQQTLADANANLAAVQAQVEANTASDQVAVANAQQALADAQRGLVDAQKTFQALPAVVREQIATARNALWSQQINRDAVCGRGAGGPCDATKAAVAAAETALNQANAQAVQQTQQGQAQVNQAQTQINQAQASLKAGEAALSSNQARFQGNLAAAQAQVNQAGAGLKTAQASLASTQARGEQTVQSAQAQVNAAASAEQTAKAAYDKIVSPPTQAELDNARALVAAQRAQVDLAQANLDATTLTAPTDGVVTAVNGAVGQWLTGGSISGQAAGAASGASTGASGSSSPNGSAFISLTDLRNLQLYAQVNEADVGRVRSGQPVTFTVDAYPGQTFGGKVAVVQPLGTSSNNVVTYTATVDVDPTPVQLLPGMTASITILTTSVPNALVIPSSAISFGQSQDGAAGSSIPAQPTPAQPGPASRAPGPATVVVVADGKGTARQIQTGASDDRNTQVVSGLSLGEQVAIGTAPS